MIYRINKKDENLFTASIGRESTSNDHSLVFPSCKVDDFVFMNTSLDDKKLNISYEQYDKDYVVVKEYEVEGKLTLDQYYFNMREFKGDLNFQSLLNIINDFRIYKSSASIINGYLKDSVKNIDPNDINISQEEFKDFVFKNSNKIIKILSSDYDFNDKKLELYSCLYTLSIIGMVAAVPMSGMIDVNAGAETFLVSALACVISCNLKNSRKNKLTIEKLLEIYNSKETDIDFIRRRTKIDL